MSGTCLTSASDSEPDSEQLQKNTRRNAKSKPPRFGSRFNLSTTFNDASNIPNKQVFRTDDQSMKTLFTSTRKDSNIQKQQRMMANTFGSASDLPSTTDMSLESLKYAKEMGIKPYHLPLLGRSLAKVQQLPANIARKSLNLSSLITFGFS